MNLPYQDELEEIGEYPSFWPMKSARYKRPITPRENLRRMLAGENPMWMPVVNTDVLAFNPSIFADTRARALVMENKIPETRGGPDFFGVEWEYVPVVGGSTVRPGSPKVPDISRWEEFITFPDPDAMDWEGCAARNKNVLEGDRAVNVTIFNGYFERLISFLDFENAAVALIDEDECEDVHRLFSRLTDFYIELFKRIRYWFNCDMITFHDDWGSQAAPLFSADVCREMIIPYIKRLAEAAHGLGMLFEQHSCGKIESHVPIMIEAGVDYWRGQVMNDILSLSQKYGDSFTFGRLILELPDNEEEIYAEAKKLIDDFAGKRTVVTLPGNSKNTEFMSKCIYALSRQYYAQHADA